MAEASRTSDEVGRLAAVKRYQILDTPSDGAFDCVAELAARIFEVPIAIISIVDSDRIWFKSHHGLSIDQVNREPGLCASAILRDTPTVITDAKVDARALSNSLVAGAFGLRFYAAAPLHTADGFNLGTLCIIDKEPRAVTDAEQATLQSLAAIVVDQLELRLNARRNAESEAERRARMQAIITERTEQLSQLSHELIRISEEEKAKLAHELHDDMGSILTLLTMKLSDMKKRLDFADAYLAEHEEIVLLVQSLIASQRRIVGSLRPVMLDSFGLAVALRSHVEDWSKTTEIKVSVMISSPLPALNAAAALALFRVAQESLTNVAKYARASSVRLTLTVEGDYIRVCIEDNGIGIAPEVLRLPSSHGIVGMRERLSQFSGCLIIEPGEGGRGTKVCGGMPLISATHAGSCRI